MMNEAVRTGRKRTVVQMPMRVLRQCLRFALYLSIKFGQNMVSTTLWGPPPSSSRS